jgi:hypothetical protein
MEEGLKMILIGLVLFLIISIIASYLSGDYVLMKQILLAASISLLITGTGKLLIDNDIYTKYGILLVSVLTAVAVNPIIDLLTTYLVNPLMSKLA